MEDKEHIELLESQLEQLRGELELYKKHILLLIKRVSCLDGIVDPMQDAFIMSPPMDRTGMLFDWIEDRFTAIETKQQGFSYVVQRTRADMLNSGRSINEVSDRVEEFDSYGESQSTNNSHNPNFQLEDIE